MEYRDYLPFQIWLKVSKFKHWAMRKPMPKRFHINIEKNSTNSPINVFIIFATRRSGHHAFIESLTQHLENYLYLNNTSDYKIIDYDHYNDKNVVLNNSPVNHIDQDINFSKWPHFVNLNLGKFGLKNIILSFENKKVDRVVSSARLNNIIRGNKINSLNIIYFERDPLNVLASIMRVKERVPNYSLTLLKQLEIWNQYHSFFTNEKKVFSNLGNFAFYSCHLHYHDFIRNNICLRDIGVLKLTHNNSQVIEPVKKLSKFGGGGNTFFEKSAFDTVADISSQAEGRFQSIGNKEMIIKLLIKQNCTDSVIRFYKNVYKETRSENFKKIITLLENGVKSN